MLPESDMAYLREAWPGFTVEQDGAGQVAVVLRGYQLPAGFDPRVVDLLLLVPFGYPDAALDMFWLDPLVTLNGAAPAATSPDQHLGKSWQRFSRHLPGGVWRPGVDDIRSYLALLATMLAREAQPPAVAA